MVFNRKYFQTYIENPLTFVVTLASTSANSWYPRAYHNWYMTTNAITAVCKRSLKMPRGTFCTVTTLGVSYSKNPEKQPELVLPPSAVEAGEVTEGAVAMTSHRVLRLQNLSWPPLLRLVNIIDGLQAFGGIHWRHLREKPSAGRNYHISAKKRQFLCEYGWGIQAHSLFW